MKIAMAQMRVESAHLQENFETIKQQVEKAKQAKADIIVFPALCVSGGCLQDAWLNDTLCEDIHAYNDKIRQLSKGIGIIFGNVYLQNKTRFNSALFAYEQAWVKKANQTLDGVHIKQNHPQIDLFNTSRYFSTNEEVNPSVFIFEKNEKVYRIGLQVDKDDLSLSDAYIKEGVDFIVNIANHPYSVDKEDSFENYLTSKWKDASYVPLIYVNACGMQNTGKNIVVFDGNSRVYTKNGEPCFYLNDAFKEELTFYDFNTKNLPTSSNTKLLDALTYAIKEVDTQMFHSSVSWIVGLSGGIDSCITACLLVKALGNKRVIGYNMASSYNSNTTKNNARQLAEHLDIEIREESIETLNHATLQTIEAYGYKDTYPSLVYENIQARIRGHLLSTFASIEGGVVINNGNKIEVALGYCTLYGDAIGAFSPLGDLSKVQCFEVARQCNNYFQKEVISKTLIPEEDDNDTLQWEMPPSAELKDAQLDPMKWYYHDEIITYLAKHHYAGIENIMQSYLDDSIYTSELGKWITYYHLEEPQVFIDDLEWLYKTMQIAAFKRIQMPPILLLSKGAYGSAYQEAQLGFIKTSRYEKLKQQILQKKSV